MTVQVFLAFPIEKNLALRPMGSFSFSLSFLLFLCRSLSFFLCLRRIEKNDVLSTSTRHLCQILVLSLTFSRQPIASSIFRQRPSINSTRHPLLMASNQPTPTKNRSFRSPSTCQICAESAIYSHYGAVVCSSCKMFFKRNGKKKRVSGSPEHSALVILSRCRKRWNVISMVTVKSQLLLEVPVLRVD